MSQFMPMSPAEEALARVAARLRAFGDWLSALPAQRKDRYLVLVRALDREVIEVEFPGEETDHALYGVDIHLANEGRL